MTPTDMIQFPLENSEVLVAIGWAYGHVENPRTFAAGSWFFAFQGEGDPEVAIRAAIADFFEHPTEDCAEAFIGHYPNWGDAIEWVPDEAWARHGLRRLRTPIVAHRISVHHDDIFVILDRARG